MNSSFFIREALDDFCISFNRTPVVLSAIQFIAGIIAAKLLVAGYYYGVGIIAILMAVLIIPAKGKLFLHYLFFVFGLVSMSEAYKTTTPGPYSDKFGLNVTISGIITEEAYQKGGFWNVVVSTVYIDSRKVNGNILAQWPVNESVFNPEYGFEVEIRGRLREPPSARNPGAFDYKGYLAGQGITALIKTFSTDSVRLLHKSGGNFLMREIVVPVRKYIRNIVDRHVGATGYLAIGILLGERRDIPEDVREDFRKTGLMHLLAVSGLNVGMVMLIAWQLVASVGLGLRSRALFSLVFVWMYAALTAFSPSVMRASIMGTVVLAGWILERPVRSGVSLMTAALLILIKNPFTLFNPGFQLSFAATWALIAIYPVLRGAIPEKLANIKSFKWLVDSLLMSASAMIGTGFILAAYFNQIAWISLFANIPAVPLSFLLLASGITIALLGWIPFLGESFGALIYWLTKIMNSVVEKSAAIPGGYIETSSPGVAFVVAYVLMLLATSRVVVTRWAKVALVCLPLVFLVYLFAIKLIIERPTVTIRFFDVGQADCALLEWKNGTVMLVDAGGRDRYGDAAKWVLQPYLKYKGINHIDAVIVSHSDEDHAGGLPNLLRSVSIGAIYHASDSAEGLAWSESWNICREKSIPLHTLFEGSRIIVGCDTLEIISPSMSGFYDDANEASIVALLKSGKHRILFTGDIGIETENNLLINERLQKVSVLKVPHHGSRKSSSEQFLNKTSPEVAIISTGRFNKYGHPHKEVIDRILRQKGNLYRTDTYGCVTVSLLQDELIVHKK